MASGAKRGRKSKYEANVKPFLSQIREWSASGATEKEICTALGIALSTFYEYKNKYPELSGALRAGRQNVVLEIKAALFKRATGFSYEEKKGVMKGGKQIGVEVYQRYSPPDTAAAAMLLRNYDAEWRDKDNFTADLKQQELELRKAIAEASNFDLSIKNYGGNEDG